MFFRRTPKNRRLGRAQVLDVKLRSDKRNAVRTRRLALTLGAVFCALFGLYLAYRTGQWLLDRLVYENPAFALQELDVQTDGIISVDQLRRWTGVRPGENLLALDLARVKRDLELVPMVQTVSVERVLPHQLRIRISEREPVAQVNIPRPKPGGGIEIGVFQLDPGGWVMQPLEPSQRAVPAGPGGDQLPVIGGINATDVQPGHHIVNPQVQAALRFVVAFEESPMAGLVDLKRIDVSSPEVLVVTTGQSSEVTFSLADFDRQLGRWRVVMEQAQKVNKAIATLDLAVTNHPPARLVEASTMAPAPLKSTKPLHLKKKHV